MDQNSPFNTPRRHPLNVTPHRSRYTPSYSSPSLEPRFASSSTSRVPSYAVNATKPCGCKCTCGDAPALDILPRFGIEYTPTATRKRPRPVDDSDKENNVPRPAPNPPSSQAKEKKNLSSERLARTGYYKNKTDQQKLTDILDLASDCGWGLSQLAYYMFRHKNEDGTAVSRTQSHSNKVQKFLAGHSKYTVADIIHAWYNHKDGRSTTAEPMFETSKLYTVIKSVRAALSAFAIQLVVRQVILQAREAVKPENGLHATTPSKHARDGGDQVDWVDIGATTVKDVTGILMRLQPLAWHIITSIAAEKPRVRNGEVLYWKRRPVDVVCTYVLSSLCFSRNQRARRLPLATGLLYFAHSAPVDLFDYGCRFGLMPAYTSVYKALRSLAQQEARILKMIGVDPFKFGILYLDNVQQHVRQHDLRIGRENHMQIGIAATYFEIEGCKVPGPEDLDDRFARINANARKDLTAQMLLGWIDDEHLETISILHWLKALCDYVPQLACYKELVSILFRTRGAKHRMPLQKTKAHPLATSGKNEVVITELKAACFDFLEQLGQTKESHLRRPMFMGGDGLTYEKLGNLQKYLQNHSDDFESCRLLKACLAVWHAEATNLTRVFSTHWGRPLSMDPSTLGHSARKINRAPPATFKKVDYYPSLQLAELVLDCRMLDCWRLAFGVAGDLFEYFAELEVKGSLPTFEELEDMARKLHRGYSSFRAATRAMYDVTGANEWSKIIPTGSPWSVPAVEKSSANIGTTGAPADTSSEDKEKAMPSEPFQGDRVLYRSILLITDLLLCREMAYATADGDPGRVYEVLKVMLFSFAGSTHSKYTNYLLEFITEFELESNQVIRDATLSGMLVNLSGRAGGWAAGDIIQEFFNRLLEVILERKGAEFGDDFIREVVSRNLHHLNRVKKDLREGLGLASKSGKHVNPHERPEFKILMVDARAVELHSRRMGRSIDQDDTNDFEGGYECLGLKGKAKRYARETIGARVGMSSVVGDDDMEGEEDELQGGEDAVDEHQESERPTLGTVRIVDGQLEIETFNFDDVVEDYIDMLQVVRDSQGDIEEDEEYSEEEDEEIPEDEF